MVRINGEEKSLAGMNLLEYLKDAGYQPEKIVVERNLEIIPRDRLQNTVIQENDSIEVLSFVGGG
nr:sulfur carrier protein ThiS [uncultured Blautia sp.]